MLTNKPVAARAAPLRQVIEGLDLVHGYLDYPVGTRNPAALLNLGRQIRALRPTALVYMVPARGRVRLLRDYLFFRACGITRIVGIPFKSEVAQSRRYDNAGVETWEPEAERLARSLAGLGDAALNDPGSWDLRLTEQDIATAAGLLDAWSGRHAYVTVSLGTKCSVKDWGKANWSELLSRITQAHPELGLVLLGAADESQMSEEAASAWKGPRLNLCGKSAPRVSAAVISWSKAFLGHDSGPMHLAAAAGVPCIAIFSARNLPGEWFPYGHGHQVLYHRTECFGCRLDICVEHAKKCIASISVVEAFTAFSRVMKQRAAGAPNPGVLQ